jgi:GMP synthase-like glutamine amidotransferase
MKQMQKKLLLIDCYREEAEQKMADYLAWLRAGAAAASLDLEILTFTDREPLPAGPDLAAVVVSGSQKMVGANEMNAGLLEFLKTTRLPLLGICYGHQVLARAFGCLVKKDKKKHLGDEEIFLKRPDALFQAFPQVFKMAESHEEIVVNDLALAANFHILAASTAGQVEAIVHRDFPFYGVQFHPEKSGETGVKLLANFLKLI